MGGEGGKAEEDPTVCVLWWVSNGGEEIMIENLGGRGGVTGMDEWGATKEVVVSSSNTRTRVL